jgi:hypothetical protein
MDSVARTSPYNDAMANQQWAFVGEPGAGGIWLELSLEPRAAAASDTPSYQMPSERDERGVAELAAAAP